MQKLAVDFTAPDSPSDQSSGPASASLAGGPASTDPKAQASAPVTLAQADIAPVQAAAPVAVPIQKAFVPAQGLVPRPKWKPF